MVKTKKGKKGVAKEEEMDSDVDVPQQTVKVKDSADKNDSVATKIPSTKTKDKKQQIANTDIGSGNDEDDDDVVPATNQVPKIKKKKNEAKPTKVESKPSNSDDEEPQQVRPAPKAKPKPKKGGFALLNVDSDDDDNEDEKQLQDSDEDEAEEVAPKGKSKTKNKTVAVKNEDSTEQVSGAAKKGKKNKKKRNDDGDEDIDKVLAQLHIEYSDGTKPQETVDAGETESKTTAPKDDGDDENNDEVDDSGNMKTAAQKKKEKKERQKLTKLAAKDQPKKVDVVEAVPAIEHQASEETRVDSDGEEVVEKDDKKKKKKKDKTKVDEPEKDKSKKGPSKLVVAAMQERLKKIKDEEERLQREAEEQLQREEEADEARIEALRLEQEKKEKKKQRDKERKDRLKAEGKLLSTKQKQDKARSQAMLEALKAQGVDIPEIGERRPRLGTRVRPNKKKDQSQQPDTNTDLDQSTLVEQQSEDRDDKSAEKDDVDDVEPIVEKIKDSWDASSSSEDESQESSTGKETKPVASTKSTIKSKKPAADDSDEEDDDSSDEGSDSDTESEPEDHRSDAEKKKERAKMRIEKRRIDADQNRSLDQLRAAVVCVLGHVDTGKTKILDKLRRTNVQDTEAGGITQQIGATNVPLDAIKEQTKIVKGFADMEFKVPGLLIIDTPGHESFSNLRSRGSSLCDIAILVVDIMHGLEPQTIESINLLKARKTPFIVALNKIDRLYDWQSMARRDVRDTIKAQAENTQLEFSQRTKEVITQFSEQGLNAALFYDNPDPRTYVSLVPTSAITGEGMGNILFLIVESCQNLLAKRLMFSEELQATVLEVKAIPGLGTTIDAILINGRLREGETMIVAGTEGPIVTQIRSLLMPQPMKELRVKNAYIEYKEIQAAQGVKIAAKELEKAIAGLNLLVAKKPDEIEVFKDEVAKELKSALSGIKLSERGVYVQASTLGSLEALLEFLKQSKIPYAGIRIGPVVKRDVMKASTMLEHESQYATILAFDVKIERDAQDLADSLGVKIFQADIIYHLFDKFTAYRDDLKRKRRDEFKNVAVFPCKMKIMPQFIFNSRDPIVMGVIVENGIVKEGTPICVPSKEFVELGVVTSIECNHKQIESARKGQEVCIKIDPIPGEAPKMFGRHFDETDMLISKISRQSIDACKDYFRDDLIKADWTLMVELKKLFEIL